MKQCVHNVSVSWHAIWDLIPGDASFSPASLQYTSFSGKGSIQKKAKHTSEVFPYIIGLSMKKNLDFMHAGIHMEAALLKTMHLRTVLDCDTLH